MSITMYDASVPVFQSMLTNLSRILGRAEAYAAERRIDPTALMHARLYPDMFPLVRQVQTACDHAKGATARLADLEPPKFSDDEQNFKEIGRRIDKTLEYIGSVPPASVGGSELRRIELKLGGREMQFEGKDYLFNYALPNFLFHVTTAYDILRHGGLNIGKRDFLG
jgi:uncharacterized protein